MNKELEKYFVIADTVQEMNGDTCEVILHELTKSGSYVAYVANGTVTGQKTGEKSDYFVEQVLENAGIDCEQALIEEIEEEKRILLSAGGQRYDIRIQAFLPVAADLNGMVCTENVQYVLYRKNTENGREYGEAIDDDFIRIQRGNTAAYEEVQEKTLF